ncbi:MAG TPA: Fic family protein [Candidatus Angelobacter sp.]|nr:Fic family protein [Candidatus Angelobacter sp.]
MVGETTPPGGATRFIETTRGLLSYSQIAPLLAEGVLEVERSIASGDFSQQPLAGELILQFHHKICGELVPAWAGRWRDAEVRVGEHHPPPPYKVARFMHDYGEDLRVRLQNTSGRIDELLLETLAYAEGRLLSIHPFNDFNGRVTRLFMRELLHRLELPPVDLVPTDSDGEKTYFAALHAGDHNDWQPLMKIWRMRFEQFTDVPP